MHLKGESHGHAYDLDAHLKADPSRWRMEWSGPDGSYRGWLQVTDTEPGSSVQLHIAVPEDRLPASEDRVGEIRRGIDQAFDRLASLLRS